MNFIDTHTHLFLETFDEDRKEIVQRAVNARVNKLFLPNINLASISKMEEMVAQFPTICYPMIGIHPSDVVKDWVGQFQAVKSRYKQGFHIGIGEIGIDLYWDKTLKAEQIAMFRAQVQWAKEENLPVSIHCREAFPEVLEVLDSENNSQLKGVLHCFTGTIEQAKHIINYGNFKLGIGGVVTYKNGGLDKVLEHIDIEHLVLETDSPFLPPVPNRGKRNESSYIPYIAEKLSEIYQLSVEKVSEITTKNALQLFNI